MASTNTIRTKIIRLCFLIGNNHNPYFPDGSSVEGGADHGLRDEAGGRGHVAAEAERLLPPQVLRLGARRRHHRLRQEA